MTRTHASIPWLTRSNALTRAYYYYVRRRGDNRKIIQQLSPYTTCTPVRCFGWIVDEDAWWWILKGVGENREMYNLSRSDHRTYTRIYVHTRGLAKSMRARENCHVVLFTFIILPYTALKRTRWIQCSMFNYTWVCVWVVYVCACTVKITTWKRNIVKIQES